MTGSPSPASGSPDWAAHSIAYLGPVGTFTEQALHTQADLSLAELVPMPTFSAVLTAVEAGEVELGFVAIANAIEDATGVRLTELPLTSERIALAIASAT